MAHFAQIDKDGIVTQIIVISNSECVDQNGIENEEIGALFCHKLLGGKWKQTSYNGRIRFRYAGIGYRYDETRDAFIAPQPYPSWIFSEKTLDWESPIPYPQDDKDYYWDEPTTEWKPVNEQ
jgi:hypothetical protein